MEPQLASIAAPLRAAHRGLAADEIRALQAAPLFAVSGFAVDRGFLILTGLILAPDGDPAAVTLEGEPGVAFQLEYPLPNPTAAEVYWYWPNAATSAFRIRIDLAASTHVGPAFRFVVRFRGRDDDPVERLRATIAVPKDLGAMQNFPGPAALQRVHNYDTTGNVVCKGYGDALRVLGIARRHGFDADRGAILDWGCGHGRVARFLRHHGAGGEVHGIDIDPQNVAWAREHLPHLSVRDGPLMPPTPYRGSRFDLVFGISVMTHLVRDVQRAWLAELRRVLKPGGLALLTFTGDSAVAFSSRFLDRAWVDEYRARGSGPDTPSKDLVGIIADPGYYRNVKLSAERAAELCSEHFAVEAIHPCMFGYQDLLVLRRPPASRRRKHAAA